MMTSLPAIHTASVIGAGAWGTTLARHLVNQGLTVKLWAYENEVVESINLKRENSLFLPGITHSQGALGHALPSRRGDRQRLDRPDRAFSRHAIGGPGIDTLSFRSSSDCRGVKRD